jgi:hypothetical protein
MTNLAILIIFGTVIRLLGIEPYLTNYGINYQSLLIFSAMFGMGGAFINKRHLPDEMATFGISGNRKRGLAALFATHPHLEDRIKALHESAYPD